MSDDKLIRLSDAIAALNSVALTYGATWEPHSVRLCKDALRALPAVTVGVSGDDLNFPNGWRERAHGFKGALKAQAAWADGFNAARDALDAALEPVAAPNLKRIGTGIYETQPTPDHAAIREAWEKAYWRMRSYAVHDNDCKLNKPPHFNGPCSCGLTAALEEALALISKGATEPTEYERKVAQMKKDFPNGI